MKKLNYLFLILFVIDLIVLLGYGQAQEETNATFTYYRIVFYWFYFFVLFLPHRLFSGWIFVRTVTLA